MKKRNDDIQLPYRWKMGIQWAVVAWVGVTWMAEEVGHIHPVWSTRPSHPDADPGPCLCLVYCHDHDPVHGRVPSSLWNGHVLYLDSYRVHLAYRCVQAQVALSD